MLNTVSDVQTQQLKKKKNHSVPQRLECDCNDNNWAINYNKFCAMPVSNMKTPNI